MADFMGGAVKDRKNILADVAAGRKAKKNIFDDVIARRADEGNYLRVFMPFLKKSSEGSRYWWLRLALAFLMVLFGIGMVALVRFSKRVDGPEAASNPRPGGGPSRAGGRATGAGKAESGAPLADAGPGAGASLERSRTLYRQPLPEFTPLKKLSVEVLDQVWDDDRLLRNTPWVAHNIKGEHRVVDHIYQFLRTHTAEELKAKADRDLTHRDMMTNPGFYRGKVVNMRAVILRVFKIYGWYDQADDDSGTPKSGVLDTTMLFVRSADRRGTHLYVVLVAEPPRNFRERDIIEFTGVFMKRFPYQRKDNKWETHPLLLTMKAPAAEVTSKDSLHLTVAIVLVVVIAMIILYFAVRGETRESEEKRRERIERRRNGRSRLQQQLNSRREGGPQGGSSERSPELDLPDDEDRS